MDRFIDRIVKEELKDGSIKEIKVDQDELKKIKNISETSKGKSKYSLLDEREVGKFQTNYSDEENHSYFVICMCGGLNGPGKWEDYLEDLKKMIINFKKEFEAWVIQIENDCCDDIHYVYIGLRANG